ncbi:hypothetical protein FRC10_009148 [Ceratobasidium sp. 414]|nr:hypothetical protein FRC10_009148 [Ceratobasidium sp. 414]
MLVITASYPLLFITIIKSKTRKVYYRYDVMIEGYQFSSKRILERTGLPTAGCIYSHRDVMEWKIWDAVDRDVQTIRMMYAHVLGFSLKVRVTRERKVRDWYFTIFGMRSVEVPQDDCHGVDVFETEDEFTLAAPDLDCDLELPGQEWKEVARDWLCGDLPSPPPSPLQTPSLPQDTFLPPVWMVDPEEPEDEREDEWVF